MEKIESSMAEKWTSPDTFVYRGKTYRVSGGYWTRGECSPLIVQEIKKRRDKMTDRFYRENNGDIYDRESGKTLEILQEKDYQNHYEAHDKNGWHKIEKNNIEEVK